MTTLRRAALALAAMRSASSTEAARGFSTNTWQPASSAATAYSAWVSG